MARSVIVKMAMINGTDVAPGRGHRKKSLFPMARGFNRAVSLRALKIKTHGGCIMGLWKKHLNSRHGATSVIDHGCEAQGRLCFVGTVAMNGKFHGELFSADTLLLGEKGEVEAEVQVAVGVISGQIKGNITGRERIELSGTARVFGNITAPVLVLEEGAVFNGQCKTDPSTRPPATVSGHSLGVPPDHRGVVLSERGSTGSPPRGISRGSESKDGAGGVPGLPGEGPPARGGQL